MAWPPAATVTLTHDDYTIAWLCALPIEKAAARNMLDEFHNPPPQPELDKNIYTFGRICEHNVVIVCQGDMGTTAASIMATRMESTFQKLRFGLLVGIAGGVPEEKEDVRLGDVVISKGDGRSGGVVVHDRGKVTPMGFESRPYLNGVPEVLRNAFSELESRLIDQDSKISAYLSQATARNGRFSAFARPTSLTDNLFRSDYQHANSEDKTCRNCAKDSIVDRCPRLDPLIHFGIVASGNQVIKDATERIRIHKAHPGVLAIEMEAAGLMNVFGCATIRGICDYADSHKNDGWHKYASATAAAVAKEVLGIIPVAKVITTLPTALAANSSHMLVPFNRNEDFVGRSSQLEELTERLNTDRFCRRVAVWGLGGIGKTQTVLEFAYQTKETCPNCSVFWVYANTATSFGNDYAHIAECLKLPGRADHDADVNLLVQTALSERESGHWILIIDNADDIDELCNRGKRLASKALVDYLPNSPLGSIIFTTRSRKAATSLAKNNTIQVDEMSQEDATEVLKKTLVQKDLLRDVIAVADLLEILSRLPLAIVQAVSYINKNGISIMEYLDLWKDSEEDIIEVLSEDFEDQGRYKDMKNPVAATWLISFNQIRRQDQLAAEYLSFMACVVRQNIPRSLLPVTPAKKQAVDAIGTLTAYSFITRQKSDDLFDMHRLVHIATRNWLKQERKWRTWNQKALQRINEVFPEPAHENKAIWIMYLPHAQTSITTVDLLDGIELPSYLLHCLAECSRLEGNYLKAEQLNRQTLELRKRRLGKESPTTLKSMNNLALSLWNQGKYLKAEEIQRETLQVQEKVLGKNHPDTLMTMNNLALSLQDQAKYSEAEDMFRQTLERREKVFGKEHPDTLKSVNFLSFSLYDQGKNIEAEDIQRQGIHLQEKILGKEHPDTLTSMNILARSLNDQGKLMEAEDIHRQTIQLQAKVLGEQHPDTLKSMNNLARTLGKQGKHIEAEALYRQTLQLEEKVIGTEHPGTLACMSNLAKIVEKQGRYTEAEALYQRTLQLKVKVLGDEHPDTLTSMNDLAVVLTRQGKYVEAEPIFRESLQLTEKVLGKESLNTVTNIHNLGFALYKQNKYAEAEDLYLQTLPLREKVLGKNHPDMIKSMQYLTFALWHQRKYEEAEALGPIGPGSNS